MSVENVRTFFGTPDKPAAKKMLRGELNNPLSEVEEVIAKKTRELAEKEEEKEWQKAMDTAQKKIALADNTEGIEPVDSRDENPEGIEGVE